MINRHSTASSYILQRLYYFLNTVIVTVGTVVVSISIGCLAGYGLARYAGMAGVVILVAALGFRALPRLAFILPYFWIGSATNLLDTHLLLILTLVAVNQPFTIWMLRSFFMDIPKELEEAAMVDGCNRLTAFARVIVPIMWPGIISTALFSLLLAYNEFLLVRILAQTNWTLPVAISRFTGGEDPRHLTLAAASAVSATIPIVLVILFFQKNLVKGLAAGAVKG
ncbi:MAG: carbohydrate ABC transporter permease [Caldilineales bacterium]|nr:carbohydrate ABC transporter permease [Caldilineales bacterium]